VAVALDVEVILTPPCIFHQWFSIQNIQGRVRMTLMSTPRRLGALEPGREVLTATGRHLAQVRETPSWPRGWANSSL
jgi:hypothetical protein